MSRSWFCATASCLLFAAALVSAQQPSGAPAAPTPTLEVRAAPSGRAGTKLLLNTSSSAQGVVQGNALTATNKSLPGVNVRLRDARVGRIVDNQVTDKAGIFVFRPVDPGSYIIEIVDEERVKVLAASDVIYVEPGQATSAIVKLPFRPGGITALFGGASTATVMAVQAATAGVLASQISGAPTCTSPID